jgi:hypothetical protein
MPRAALIMARSTLELLDDVLSHQRLSWRICSVYDQVVQAYFRRETEASRSVLHRPLAPEDVPDLHASSSVLGNAPLKDATE